MRPPGRPKGEFRRAQPEGSPVSCECKPEVPQSEEAGACSGSESFALRVLGDDMAPEFLEGEIIIIEPDGALKDGSFVLANLADEWIFRQLRRTGEVWSLRALNPQRTDLPELPLADLSAVRGVVIQKAVPGRRKLSKFYI